MYILGFLCFLFLLFTAYKLTRKQPSQNLNSKSSFVRHLALNEELFDHLGRFSVVFLNQKDRFDDENNFYTPDDLNSLAIQLDTIEAYRLVDINPVRWVRYPEKDPKI